MEEKDSITRFDENRIGIFLEGKRYQKFEMIKALDNLLLDGNLYGIYGFLFYFASLSDLFRYSTQARIEESTLKSI